MEAITLEQLRKSYDEQVVIESLSLTIPAGEFVTLLGPSGSGKTTALRCVAGLEEPSGGAIHLNGTTVAEPGRRIFVPPERRRVGFVFQNYALWPHMTVGQIVGYPLRVQRVGTAERHRRVSELLRSVGLEAMTSRPVSQLSGGQQQRVALARAMANGSNVMLYDEPLSNLDAQLRVTTRKVIRMLHEQRPITSVYVTHDQVEALSLSDRVVIINSGVIEQDGTPEAVFRRPSSRFVARFLGCENFARGQLVGQVADGRWSVHVPGLGTTVARCANGAAGAEAEVAFRAHHVKVGARDGREQADAAKGLVRAMTFLGDSWHVDVEVANPSCATVTAELRGELRRSEMPAAGDTVPIAIEHDDVVAFCGDGRRESLTVGLESRHGDQLVR